MLWKLKKGKPAKPETMLVRNETRNSVLADAADVADSAATRRKGLLGRDGLRPGEALWITPCEAVHTWGMKFPIDVVYLNRKKKVRKIRRAMRPWRMSVCLFAHSVLELPAGSITRTETCVGDQLRFECGGDGGESAIPESGVPEEHAGPAV
jgi:uncharacterized protein